MLIINYLEIMKRPWITIVLLRTSLKLICIVSLLCLIISEGKQFLFKNFVGFNDCQENWAPVKRAIQILSRNINRYYKDQKESKVGNLEEIKLTDSLSKEDVLVPFDFYSSKVLDDIDVLIINSNFRSNQMSKIENNIEIIHKMFYEENKDIDYISKWLRIPIKKFIRCMSRYKKWVENRSKDVQAKNQQKIERIQDIKGLIQMYLALNKGKWINIKRILDFISPWNL